MKRAGRSPATTVHAGVPAMESAAPTSKATSFAGNHLGATAQRALLSDVHTSPKSVAQRRQIEPKFVPKRGVHGGLSKAPRDVQDFIRTNLAELLP